jgi:4-hydroxy-3-polyprenylbenzoate decarboxylase
VQIIVGDDSAFIAAHMRNYLWVTYTRANPAQDIYGIRSFTENKHWGCDGPMIVDARIKPHHAPPVELTEEIRNRSNRLFEKGGPLYKIA